MIDKQLVKAIFNPKQSIPPAICAEMSGNHQGSLESAIAFAKTAKANGADLLKLQVYTPDTITLDANNNDFKLSKDNDWSQYETLYSLYKKAYTPWSWVEEIFKESNKIDLPIFASPFDLKAVSFLEELNCPIYKIASPEINDTGLISACANTGKPIILSTGLANKEDIDLAVEIIQSYRVPYMILKCVSAYPTPIKDMNISTLNWLKDTYGCSVGLSDHTLGMNAGFAATALGASMIEKHFRMADDETSVDSSFSMNIDKIQEYKEAIHNIYSAIGEPTLEIPEIAKPSLSGRRSLYVTKDIAKGDLISHENVRSIRPSYGMPPKHLPEIIGRAFSRDVKKGERMSWGLISNE